MTQVERDVLKSLKDQLLKSTESGFNGPADFDDWVYFAKRMKTTIKTSDVVFEALLKQPVTTE